MLQPKILFQSAAIFIGISCATASAQTRTQDGEQPQQETPPAWTQLPLATEDYIPPNFRVVNFPSTSVGSIYLASRTGRDGQWEPKHDGYQFWAVDSLGQCRLGLAQGRVAIPVDHPIMLRLNRKKDISFLKSIPDDTFVAIDAQSVDGNFANLSCLMSMGSEQIGFPSLDRLTDAEVSALPVPRNLKHLPYSVNSTLAPTLARCKQITRLRASAPLRSCWQNHPTLRHLQLSMHLSYDATELLEYQRQAISIVASIPNLKELTVNAGAGKIVPRNALLLTALSNLDSIDLELSASVVSDPPLDREGATALSKIQNLRSLKLNRISPDAYPVLERLSISSLSTNRHRAIDDAKLLRHLAANKNLKNFPSFKLPAQSLRPLIERTDIESLALESIAEQPHSLNDPVYTEIVLANTGLVHLKLDGITIDSRLAAAILKCSNLESLTLVNANFPTQVNFAGTLNKLKELSISEFGHGERPWALGLKCPEVTDVELTGRWLWPDIEVLKDCRKIQRLRLGTNGPFDGRFLSRLKGMPELWDLSIGVLSKSLLLSSSDLTQLAKYNRMAVLNVEGNLKAEDLLPLRANGLMHYLKVKSPELLKTDTKYLAKIFPCRLKIRPINSAVTKQLVTLPDGITRIRSVGMKPLEGQLAVEALEARLTHEQFDSIKGKAAVVLPQMPGSHSSSEDVPPQLKHCPREVAEHRDLVTMYAAKDLFNGISTIYDAILIDKNGVIRFVSPHPYHMDVALKRILEIGDSRQ